ncbi:MAG: thiamine pyrophosphate-dependent enzyme, partial [Acidobacteriota bacterium]
VTGDGDALSIGGNHLIHALRRNVGLKVLLFNNRIYGLTKGQYSPTSEVGKRTSSTPMGSIDAPFNPLALALGAGASFVARSVDIFQPHLISTLGRAAEHKGTAFIEIYQNCNIFNDKAFAYMTDKANRSGQTLEVAHGQPLVFDKGQRGLVPDQLGVKDVELGGEYSADDCLVYDETNPMHANMMAHLMPPSFPTPIGVMRSVEQPAFESAVVDQVQKAVDDGGDSSLDDLLSSGETWTVE